MSTIRIAWSAAGASRDAALAVADQAKLARQQYPSAGATIVAARDEVLTMIRDAGDEVSVSCVITLDVRPLEVPPVADVVATDEDDGERLPGKGARRWR